MIFRVFQLVAFNLLYLVATAGWGLGLLLMTMVFDANFITDTPDHGYRSRGADFVIFLKKYPGIVWEIFQYGVFG